jgi:hypothetical protein
MSLGVGLGAFVSGFRDGYGMRRQIDADRRADKDRKAMEAIDTDAKTEFDRRVAAGEAEKDQFESFWLDYALPKKRNELLRQGDVAGARQLQEWGESDAALKGGKLFSSALLKAQTGDAEGALQDVISAGKIKGYIEHGYEVLGQEPITDASGNVVGYRLKIQDGDGKKIEQDIATADLPRLIATFANPEAAFASQLAAQQEKKKKADELTEYEDKKKIDQKYKADPEGDYAKAREARLKNDLDFGDLSPEEQDKVIRADLEAGSKYAAERGGGGAESDAPANFSAPPAAGGKRIVDTVTGEEVPVTPNEAAPGLSPKPDGVERRPLPAPAEADAVVPTSSAESLGAAAGRAAADRAAGLRRPPAAGATRGISPDAAAQRDAYHRQFHGVPFEGGMHRAGRGAGPSPTTREEIIIAKQEEDARLKRRSASR